MPSSGKNELTWVVGRQSRVIQSHTSLLHYSTLSIGGLTADFNERDRHEPLTGIIHQQERKTLFTS
jgi:hypothetical protein